MSTHPTFVRRGVNWLVLRLLKLVHPAEKDWALAMAAEVDVIESDWAALWFALGCLRATAGMKMGLGLARQGLALLILGWAGAKIYLAVWSTQYDGAPTALPDWLGTFSLAAAVAYAGAGVSLSLRRYGLMAAGLIGALIANGAIYMSALAMDTGTPLFLLAIAGEDYFIWTGSLAAACLILWLGRQTREVAT